MTYLDGNIVDVPNPSDRGPGYRYFGAVKKLPGVPYYSYRDGEDGILKSLEKPAEKAMRDDVKEGWHRLDKVRKEAKAEGEARLGNDEDPA
ncbi:hypothetical protein RYX36_027136 [Vicia faba]